MTSHRHPPSHARALLREARGKGGRDARSLLDEARQIADPAYVAVALHGLCANRDVDTVTATKVLAEVAAAIHDIDREWRRAEIMTELAGKMPAWRERDDSANAAKLGFFEALVDEVANIRVGEARSAAIQGLAKHVTSTLHIQRLRDLARNNDGFEAADLKTVLRQVGRNADDRMVKDVLEWDFGSKVSPARMLGYLHVQSQRRSNTLRGKIWKAAVDAAWAGGDTEDVRYLATHAKRLDDLRELHGTLTHAGDDETAARVLATLAAMADKQRAHVERDAWLKEGLARVELIREPAPRALLLAKYAEAFTRARAHDRGNQLLAAAKEFAVQAGDVVERKVEQIAQRLLAAATGGQAPVDSDSSEDASPDSAGQARDAAPATGRGGATGAPGSAAATASGSAPRGGVDIAPASGHRLALVDTYEGGLKTTHFRAIARAAPLCAAFGLDLVLVGFPTKDLPDLLRASAKETNIGGGGRYLRALADASRVHLVTFIPDAPLTGLTGVHGVPVATTAKPQVGKLVADLAELDAGICLLMGLGRKGLPPKLMEAAPHHYEITGAHISFETATAMGVLAERLRAIGA